MNTENNLPQNDQEIDFSKISESINAFFNRMLNKVFMAIIFFIKNKIIIGVLFVIGFGIGFYLDTSSKLYTSEIIVTPNFGSNSYLYSRTNLLKSKFSEKDEKYLKSEGFDNVKNLGVIEIKPVLDIYSFIGVNDKNFEFIKLMAEDGDINTIISDKITSKNYPFHQIIITSSQKISDKKVIAPILSFLNNSDYYKKIREEYIKNIAVKMKANDSIINQIDNVLNTINNSNKNGSKSNNLVYYNENSQLNDIIKTKESLITEQGKMRLDLVTYDKVIKDISITTNIEKEGGIINKMKFIIPLLFVFLFVFYRVFINFYKNQKQKYIKQ